MSPRIANGSSVKQACPSIGARTVSRLVAEPSALMILSAISSATLTLEEAGMMRSIYALADLKLERSSDEYA